MYCLKIAISLERKEFQATLTKQNLHIILLGVLFKIYVEHSRPFYIGASPGCGSTPFHSSQKKL